MKRAPIPSSYIVLLSFLSSSCRFNPVSCLLVGSVVNAFTFPIVPSRTRIRIENPLIRRSRSRSRRKWPYSSYHHQPFLCRNSEGSLLIPSLSLSKDNDDNGDTRRVKDSTIVNNAPLFSRREVALITVGGLAYGKVVSSAISKIKRGDAYPPQHESRVSDVFKRTWMEAAAAYNMNMNKHQEDESASMGNENRDRPLRVLEVGIGSSCRTIVRGLYDDAIIGLSTMNFDGGIDFTGIDIDVPSVETVNMARERLYETVNKSSRSIGPVSLNVVTGDLVQGLPFPDGYFDAITCSLVLCSVSDQVTAVKELNRLLNPDGGTFGYVEHVAVRLENESEQDRSFLELEQRYLDPLQQAVAHNCHLHRDTDRVIAEVFKTSNENDGGITARLARGQGDLLQSERFFVDDMWPVSCQCSGVVKLRS